MESQVLDLVENDARALLASAGEWFVGEYDGKFYPVMSEQKTNYGKEVILIAKVPRFEDAMFIVKNNPEAIRQFNYIKYDERVAADE